MELTALDPAPSFALVTLLSIHRVQHWEPSGAVKWEFPIVETSVLEFECERQSKGDWVPIYWFHQCKSYCFKCACVWMCIKPMVSGRGHRYAAPIFSSGVRQTWICKSWQRQVLIPRLRKCDAMHSFSAKTPPALRGVLYHPLWALPSPASICSWPHWPWRSWESQRRS